MSCYVDTSAFYAYLVKEDRFHEPVRDYLRAALGRSEQLFSSSLVLGEILGLLQTRHGLKAARLFMSQVYPLVQWRWIDRPQFERIWRVFEQNSRRGLTAVDAAAVVCIEDRPGSVCVALDDDLRKFSFPVVP